MADLEVIARIVRRSVDQIRRPTELIRQGLDPVFLSTYRADEIGQLDSRSLGQLQRALIYLDRVDAHRDAVRQQLSGENQWSDSLETLLKDADSVALIDRLTRSMRARKSSRALAEKQPEVTKLGEALLTLHDQAPENLDAWAAEQLQVDQEQASHILAQTRRWLQMLLNEDPHLLLTLGRLIYKKAMVSVTLLDEKDDGEDKPADDAAPSPADDLRVLNDSTGIVGQSPSESKQPTSDLNEVSPDRQPDGVSMPEATVIPELASQESLVSSDAGMSHEDIATADLTAVDMAFETVTIAELSQDFPHDDNSPEVMETNASDLDGEEVDADRESNVTDAPAVTEQSELTAEIASFQLNKGVGQRPQTRSLKGDSKLSPRQRRRRWLRSVLESYTKLRKPLTKLTPYQVLMLGRGQRSQLIRLNIEYDLKPLVHAARESFGAGRHPLHAWLMDVAEEALTKLILPRLEQDLLGEMEEAAHQELMEMAVEHLEASLMQRPVRGHRILMIDAIGPKTAALAIIDYNGDVLHSDELPCNSSRADVVSQNVTLLGQLAHRFRVSVVGISNGPARRYLIHSISELMKQSMEGSLLWTMIDRAGADAYCASRISLQELPKISRRHRAAVWLGRRLQDPLKEILKVDPARLRLGSYQRELPQEALSECLESAVFGCMASQGVDLWNVTERILEHVPGIDRDVAKAIAAYRRDQKLTSRENLRAALGERWSENDSRLALGFLRVFGSDQPLDATGIHPEDYRLAQRLVDNSEFTLPSSTPPGWSKPSTVTPTPIAENNAHSKSDASPQPSTESAAEQGSVADEDQPPTEIASLETASLETASLETVSTETVSTETAMPESVSQEASETNVVSDLEPTSAVVAAETAAPTPQSDSISATASATDTTPATQVPAPVYTRPELKLDVDKLARSWQVGPEKLRQVANCLLDPYGDSRDALHPIPLMTRVPTLDNLTPGMSTWAVIIGVAQFGAFADLGPDCSGLIHVSRLSSQFVEDPHQIAQVGDLVRVWVVEVDHKRRRVALTMIPPGTPNSRHTRTQEHEPSRERPPVDRPRPRGDRPPRQVQQGSTPASDGRSRSAAPGSHGGRPSGNRDDQRRGQRPRGDRPQYEGQRPKREWQQAKVRPPKPVQPISEEMEKGKEPLRSFSDLMQFYQKKRDEPQPPNAPPSSDSGSEPS